DEIDAAQRVQRALRRKEPSGDAVVDGDAAELDRVLVLGRLRGNSFHRDAGARRLDVGHRRWNDAAIQAADERARRNGAGAFGPRQAATMPKLAAPEIADEMGRRSRQEAEPLARPRARGRGRAAGK